MSRPIRVAAALVFVATCAAGCAPAFIQDTSGVQTAKPAAFAYPGIYTGFVSHGTLTYKISSDGRGRSCFRNQLGARMFFGDVTYDGARLHTEDGAFEVDSLAPDELRLHTPYLQAVLRRVESAPSTCSDFFSKP